jgi:hypothetical protein
LQAHRSAKCIEFSTREAVRIRFADADRFARKKPEIVETPKA